MPDDRTYVVLDEDGNMVSALSTRYDKAGAEHFAQGQSRRHAGEFLVVPAFAEYSVSRFKNGKKVK